MRNLSGLVGALLALMLVVVPLRVTSAQQATPQPIAYGQTILGDLAPDRTIALYVFTAQAGDSITITMDTDGTSPLDPLLILVDQSQQTVLAVDNDSGGNRNSRLRFVIPAAGTYVIRATGVQGIGEISGNYKLSLQLGNPTPTPSGSANALVLAAFDPNNEMRGDLSDAMRFHLYTLKAKKGEAITASLQIPDGPDKLQAGIYLYTPDFHEVGRAELGSALNVQASADGLYFLMVARSAPTGAGSYILKREGAPTQSSQSIAPGQTIHGTISADAAVKTYSLQGSSGQTISVRERRLSGDLATYVYVVSIDDGKTLAQATDQNGVAEVSVTLPAAGTYAVVATRAGQQTGTTTGNFALTVSLPGQTTPVPAAFQNYTAIEYGASLSNNIDDTTYAVPYYFTAEAGDTIQATMTADSSGDLDPYLILQNANGDTLFEDDNSAGKPNALLQATLTQSGPYALIATRADLARGKTSGKFTLTLDTTTPPEAATGNYGTLLVAGQAQSSPAELPVMSVYRFEAQANTAASVDFVPAGGFEGVTILADSDFNQLAVAQGSIRTTSLPHAGIYYVLVGRAGGANQAPAGSYSLTLQGSVNVSPTAEPGMIVFGQAVTGSISNDVYQVRYKLQAKKGQNLVITMDAAPGSTLDPLVGIVDSGNSLLGVNDDSAAGLKNASLTITIPADGLYSIVATRAQEATGTTSGDFILKVELQNTSPDLVPIHYGGTVSATIDDQHYLYYYTFQGQQGDVITIHMSRVPGNDLDSALYLYDYTTGKPELVASNNDVSSDNPDSAIVKFTLPQTGPYLIAATRVGNAQGKSTGNFILTLDAGE